MERDQTSGSSRTKSIYFTQLGVPRSRELVRKIKSFQHSLENNKILWLAGISKQTEITVSYKKKELFHAVNGGVYFQATVKSSL